MANYGKRMVPEYLIKQIGEGGGATYTAGDGININSRNVISVDTDTIATKEYVDEHGGSVDIDNKTIVENADGELETAVGGYKETQSLGYGPNLVGTASDWDLVDSTLANTLYNMLDVDTQYPVTLKFIGCAPAQEIASVYIESSSKTEYRFGGNGALHITTIQGYEYQWEFYVDISNNNIHIYTANTLLDPVTGSNIIIDFGSESGLPENIVTNYHKIDSNYLNYEFTMTSAYKNLTDDEFNYIYNNKKIINILTQYRKFSYSYEDGDYVYFDALNDSAQVVYGETSNGLTVTHIILDKVNKTLSEGGNQTDIIYTDNETIIRSTNDYGKPLKTAIGGGYFTRPEITLTVGTDTDSTSVNNRYTVTNQDFIDIINNAVVESFKNNEDVRDYIYTYIIETSDDSYQYGLFTSYSIRTSGGYTYFEATQNGGINFSIQIDSNYDLVSSTVSLFNNEFNDVIDFKITLPTNRYFGELQLVDSKFLPAFNVAPTVAGTYVLKATVDAQGNVTYTWVAEV